MSYQYGSIYRIICQQDPDIQYIGSTFMELRHRFLCHKKGYVKYLKGIGDNISIFPYFDKYGVDDFKIILIKKYLVYREHQKDRRHLCVYEQLWMNKIKCVNKINSIPLPKFLKKIQKREYQIKNAEYIKARIGEYYKCECGMNVQRGWKSGHEKTQKHKEYINPPPLMPLKVGQSKCDCGLIALTKNLKRQYHINSKRHQAFLKTLETVE